MNRLTGRLHDNWVYLLGSTRQNTKEFNLDNQIAIAMQKLAAYEDIGFEPEDISSNIKTLSSELNNAFEELKVYRNLEEQGLLIKLPCKVGDTVYWISPFRSGINQGKIEFLNINKFGFDLAIMRQEGVLIRRGLETVFLTREEAEKALEGNK